jgi:hypothetical protein
MIFNEKGKSIFESAQLFKYRNNGHLVVMKK